MIHSLGQEAFRKLGCHPGAVKASRERSSAVWLLGAVMAKDEWYAAPFMGTVWDKGPECIFLSGFDTSRIDPAMSRELARLDGVTLERWLSYARKVLARTERWLAYQAVTEMYVGGMPTVDRVLEVYQAASETRREYG